MEGAAQQAHRVGEVGLVEAVGAEHAVGDLGGAPQGGGVGDEGLVDTDLGGGVPARVAQRVLPVGTREGRQRVLSGPPRDRLRDLVDHLRTGEQGDARAQLLEVLDVRVQTRVLHAEVPGHGGQRHVLEAGLVGEIGGGRDDAVGAESGTGHGGTSGNLGLLGSSLYGVLHAPVCV
ncbi:hypothetical protein GCM10010377_07760 [Streptomyces viridiviolaceus]|nr:hypothetical protein GCM10010377_07760 [Streptomyces viridiviolaceus]